MKIELFFNTKNEITLRERFIEDINCCGGEGKIAREENTFAIQLCGNEEDAIEMSCLIWEMAFLYEGYFYSLDKYLVDGKWRNVNKLCFLLYYKNGKICKIFSSYLAVEKNGLLFRTHFEI